MSRGKLFGSDSRSGSDSELMRSSSEENTSFSAEDKDLAIKAMQVLIRPDDSLEPRLGQEYKYELLNQGKGAEAAEDPSKKVRYYGVEESSAFKVAFGAGVSRRNLYVFAPTADLFVPGVGGKGSGIDRVGAGVLRHSSITHSQEPEDDKSVSCAGEIKIRAGKITYMDNSSGHFKPGHVNLYIAAKTLETHFAVGAKIGVVAGVDSSGDAIISEMPVKAFMAAVEEKLKETPDFQQQVNVKIEELQVKRVQIEQEQQRALEARPRAAIEPEARETLNARRRRVLDENSPVKANGRDEQTPKGIKRALFEEGGDVTPLVLAASDRAEKKQKNNGAEDDNKWQKLVGKREQGPTVPLSTYNRNESSNLRTPPTSPFGRW